jgi:hypothetical protein
VSRIERGLNVPSNQALEKIEQALRDGGEPIILPDVITI